MNDFATTPEPPYYAVVFSAQLGDTENADYHRTADRMLELATEQPGFLGFETARSEGGFGISVSYWASLEAIANWKANAEHMAAQESGKSSWYRHYELRIARVERAYGAGRPASRA